MIEIRITDKPTQPAEPAPAAESKPRFDNVSCSQCGLEFGPGNNGFSHCLDHQAIVVDESKDYKALYEELILAVGNKHFGETRHQTALRYIRSAEYSGTAATESKRVEGAER